MACYPAAKEKQLPCIRKSGQGQSSPSWGEKQQKPAPTQHWAVYTGLRWHWPSGSPLGRRQRYTSPTAASFGHIHEECTSAKTPPLSNLDKRAHWGWQDSRGIGQGGHSQSEQLPRAHQDLSTAQLPTLRFRKPQGCFSKMSPLLNLQLFPLP